MADFVGGNHFRIERRCGFAHLGIRLGFGFGIFDIRFGIRRIIRCCGTQGNGLGGCSRLQRGFLFRFGFCRGRLNCFRLRGRLNIFFDRRIFRLFRLICLLRLRGGKNRQVVEMFGLRRTFRIGGIQFAVAFGRDFAQLFHRALVNGTAFVGIAPVVPAVVQVRLGTVNGFGLTAAFQWRGIFVTVEIAQFALPLAVEIKPPADQGGYGNQ